MNLDELRTFLEVIDSGSLAAAAPRLNVTPSTVTARINTLEEQLGCRLLHRNKAGTELTAAGFRLQRYAELMTQLWRQARYDVGLPPGVEGACNVGLEFDLWRDVGSRFLDHIREHAPGIAVALWPGEQRQLKRWLDIGLIDVALGYVAEAGEGFTSRLLIEDELVLVSARRGASAEIDDAYVFVDHGDEFRRQHAEAFPVARPSRVTIAASDWALEYLQRTASKGYLPTRVVAPLVAAGRLHRVDAAPRFLRRVYLVESARAVREWSWYEAAVVATRPD
jgi:LysR family transcriptional regulator, flagellar master operon regulator